MAIHSRKGHRRHRLNWAVLDGTNRKEKVLHRCYTADEADQWMIDNPTASKSMFAAARVSRFMKAPRLKDKIVPALKLAA